MTLALRYAARSDTGLVRDGNEDSVYAGPRLLAVADGMGGHAAGEVASAVVISALAPLDEDVPGSDLLGALRAGVERANERLADVVSRNEELRGMGTTLTALLADGGRVGLVHVGDSRAYLLRDDELRQLTTDHTLVQALVDEGRITPDEADVHPQRSWISRTLSGSPVELDLSLREARPGDRFLVCSDGLSGVVSLATLADTLRAEPDPGRCTDRLVELALRGGGPDNVTCVVADVVEAETAPVTTPVLAGAVATEDGDGALPDTAAGRAAAMSSRLRPRRRRRADGEGDAGAAAGGAPRRRRRLLLASGLVLVLLAGLVGAAAFWLRSQVYVGVHRDHVAVLRGVTGDALGVPLHRVSALSEVPLDQLPPYEQEQVRSGIVATGPGDAERIVDRLRAAWQSARCAAPTPPASGAPPAPGASPAPGGAVTTGCPR